MAGLSAVVALAALGLMVSGCTETKLATYAAKQVDSGHPPAPGKTAGVYKIGKPYQINGVWYYPAEDPTYDQTGIASWYGAPFHGQATANGETYDQNELTAAHQTLPLPTYARVTDLENGRSIVVRINDRGPFVNGRIIDLSRRAAQLLGYQQKGTARVRVQVIRSGDGEQGSDAVAKNAAPPVSAAPRVAVAAQALPPPAGMKGQTPKLVTPRPMPSSAALLASADQQPKAELADYRKQTIRQEPVTPTGLYIQAGAFTQYENANRLRARISTLGSANVSSVQVNGTEFFRVRLGPLASVDQADQALQQIINLGQTDAKIVVN